MKIIDSFIRFQDVHQRLDLFELEEAERLELLEIIEDALLHRFLDVLLTDLDDEDRVFVLEKFASGDHPLVVEFVRERKPNIHLTLSEELEKAKQELLTEMESNSL